MFFNQFQVDITQRDWLRNSGWDRDKENMILIHGYGGSVDALPMSVLRDGKLFWVLARSFVRSNFLQSPEFSHSVAFEIR